MDGSDNYTHFTFMAATGQSNPDNWKLISLVVLLIGHIGLVNLLSVVGLAGNAISIVVLRKHGIAKDSTNVMLIALSFFDFMYSLVSIIRQSPFIVLLIDIQSSKHLDRMLYFYSIHWIDDICTIVSVTITSAIAIERFVAVFFPFKVARIFTPFRVKLIVIFIVVYVCGIVSPSFNRYTIIRLFDTKNITQTLLSESDWWVSNRLTYYSHVWLNSLLGSVNMAIVFFCGTTTALKLAHTIHTRQRLSNKTTAADMKVHKMILIICGTCLLVFVPTTILDTVIDKDLIINPYLQIFRRILYGLYASTNFVIYIAVSRKFYITYKSLIC